MKRTILLLCALLIAAPAVARELYWKTLDVGARIDANGTIDVVERHDMIFTGDWNGGETKFDLAVGQKLQFLGMNRITAEGQRVPMRRGELDTLDTYDFVDSETLRWRSRYPDSPEFAKTPLSYELRYRISNVLVPPRGEREDYLLSHDFAFANRTGPIEKFRARIELDSAWQSDELKYEYLAYNIPADQGFVVRLPLKRVSATLPSSVRFGAPVAVAIAAVAFMWIAFAAIVFVFVRGEARHGRFERLPEDPIDAAWLDKNVFFAKPETIGFLWDRSAGTSEVAAILARLAQEGKLETTVVKGGLLKSPGMEMKWTGGDRAALEPHVRELIDALFFDGDFTSTELLKEQYKSSGFNPVSKVSGQLEALVKRNAAWIEQPRKPLWKPLAFVLGVAVVLAIVATFRGGADVIAVAVVGIGAVFAVVFGTLIAYSTRFSIPRVTAPLAGATVLPAALAVTLTFMALSSTMRLAAFTILPLVLLVIAVFAFAVTFARIPETRQQIAMRTRLIRAREYFQKELQKSNPQLRDEWMPYLIALGLGPHVDKWVKAFGVAAPVAVTSATRAGSPMGSSSQSPSWTGGGGAFGGAGASGSWAIAAGSIASGVASPGSSSGGGGGFSSGGGSRGGW